MSGVEKSNRFVRNILMAIAAVSLLAAVAALMVRHKGSVAKGAVVYLDQCAICHGPRQEGQPNWRLVNASGRLPAPPLDGSGHGWRHSDAELFHMIKFSMRDQAGPGYQTDMPAFGGKLSDEDMLSVVAFIKSRWPSGIQAAQSFLNPNHAGMPSSVDPDWRLPPDCDEPVRGAPAP